MTCLPNMAKRRLLLSTGDSGYGSATKRSGGASVWAMASPPLAFRRRSPLLFSNVPYRNYFVTIHTLSSGEHSDDASRCSPRPCSRAGEAGSKTRQQGGQGHAEDDRAPGALCRAFHAHQPHHSHPYHLPHHPVPQRGRDPAP
jgi:hypothetical protein